MKNKFLVKRFRIASVSAIPNRSAVAYLTIWSYCCLINSQLIGLVNTGCRFGKESVIPTSGDIIFDCVSILIGALTESPINDKMQKQLHFGHVYLHGLDRARGYGQLSMSTQAKLTAIAVNLKRIAKILSSKKLLITSKYTHKIHPQNTLNR